MAIVEIYLRPIGDPTKFLGTRRYNDENPLPVAGEGLEWVVGQPPDGATAFEDLTNPAVLVDKIVGLVEAISIPVVSGYAGDVALIGQYLDKGNINGAIDLFVLLKGKIDAAADTDAQAAITPIVTLLTSAGKLS